MKGLNMENWKFVVRSAAGEETVSLRELAASPVFAEVVRRVIGVEALKRLADDPVSQLRQDNTKLVENNAQLTADLEEAQKKVKQLRRLLDAERELSAGLVKVADEFQREIQAALRP